VIDWERTQVDDDNDKGQPSKESTDVMNDRPETTTFSSFSVRLLDVV
jgi:hypothetical protein